MVASLGTQADHIKPKKFLQERDQSMSANSLILGKAIEAMVIQWLVEAQWPVYTPFVDIDEVDLIARNPATRRLVSIQIKHKEPGSWQDYIKNHWKDGDPLFDVLVLYQKKYDRGFALPKEVLRKANKHLYFEKYIKGTWQSTGEIDDRYKHFVFSAETFTTVLSGL
jgi:hypothetical protein